MVAWTYRVRVEFSVLGPIRVDAASGRIEIRGVKERLLLGMLLAHAGRTVGVSELVDALWGEAPPRTAAKSLQTYVLRLRNVLEPERAGEPTLLVTDGQGYRLEVDPRQVDAGRFERLVCAAEHGHARERLALLREGLDLWRGRAYADLGSAPSLATESTRLEELRMTALEQRFAAELDLGRHRAVVPELERLVADHPLRERGWALLMTALYRDGRQADALAAYDRARTVLADELGIDPGAALRGLHASVLAQDAALQHAGPVAVPEQLRSNDRTMHGREAELEKLRHAWRLSRSGSRVLLLRTPPGGGARRLAAALAEELADEGVPIVYEGPTGQQPPAPRPGMPALVVRDRVAAEAGSVPGLVLRLADPDTSPDGADDVLDLGPLDPVALRQLVAEQVPHAEVDLLLPVVAERSGGWPGRAHAAVRSYLRETARASVRTAASDTEVSLAHLHDARQRLVSGVLELQPRSDLGPPTGRCPWPGLVPYDVDDGPLFAGRERLVAELVARTSGASFLAVVGASGSGKSSVVRAGLVAALADDALPGSAAWTTLVMRPGSHPMRELAHRVLGVRRPEAGAILEQLLRHGDAADRTVLLVDQCEEVWTACDDDGERQAFLDTLADLATDTAAGVTVVVVLRADYLDRVADHPALASLVSDHSVLVGLPTPDDVRRAVERPARAAGLELDVGLLDAVVDDAGAEPGLLPLLSTSMAQLWEAREGQRLTFAGYVGSGGLRGAIGHLAEATYQDLAPEEQEAARSLLLRLTGPGDGTAVTRRRVAVSELAGLPTAGAAEVVERLTAARLLTSSDGHVEVAHEALFREWPRLAGWLTEDAAGRAVQRRMAVSAREWEAESRDPALLWRGTRLDAGAEVAAARPEEVTDLEREFLVASEHLAESERQEAERRADAEARQNRRLRLFLVGMASVLTLALLAGVLAMVARGQASEAAAEAEDAAVAADAKRLAASALNIDYPDLALLTAVEATRLEQSPETFGALLTLLARQPDVATSFRTSQRFLRNAASPDGGTVYVSENEPVLRALDAVTGDALWETELNGQVGSISPSPDGRGVAAVVFADGHDEVVMLDPLTGATAWRLGPEDYLPRLGADSPPFLGYRSGWTEDGRLVVGNDVGVVALDAAGQVVGSATWPSRQSNPFGLTVWPDGRVSANDSEFGATTVVDLDRPQAPESTVPGLVTAVSSDGRRALAVSEDAVGMSLRLVDGRTLRPAGPSWPIEGFVQHAAFSTDGSRIAVSVDDRVLIRDGRTLAPLDTLAGHSGSVMSVAWAGTSGDLVWTAGRDGRAVGFDVTGRRGVIRDVPGTAGTHSGETAVSGTSIHTDYNPASPNRAYLRQPGESAARKLPVGVDDCLCQAEATELTPDGAVAAVGYAAYVADPFGRIDDVGYVVLHDGVTGDVTRVVETPWPVAGLGTTPDGEGLVVSGGGGWGVLDPVSGALEAEDLAPYDLPSADGTALVEVAPDGERAVLLRGAELVLLDLTSPKVLATRLLSGEGHRALSAAWAGDRLAVGTVEGWLYVVDGDSLEDVAPRRLITGGFVIDVEVSPAEATAATLGSDGDLILWDTANWRPYGEPVLDDRGWGFLGFAPDSSVRVDYEDGTRAIVESRPEEWVAAACEAANRDLTADENAIVRPGQPVRPTCD